ncbi:MAG: DNA mismatch repair endonuclease MutL [Nitrospinota bacterium]|nr:DNA mismatch repair endonuclease MutL [Nitrospinota bacterium]
MLPSTTDRENPRIQVLPADMANKIAAGEVIERPASVVKELLENSIDAGSTQITVEIKDAGKTLIKVADNGTGMVPEDTGLVFHRHATSKVIQPHDLVSIKTLGFRGEALSSIASIAKVKLSTAKNEGQEGREVVVDGGEIKQTRKTARPRGTTVAVQQLFFNTPARKKFLKRDATEFSHISQVATQQALANPHIHFTLTHNGRKVFSTLPTEQSLYRIAELFGSELAKELVRLEAQNGNYRLEGYISSPVFTRSNRASQYFYVNQRFIRNKVILHATQQGYGHLLPKNQHPVLFLFLSMDPGLVDVNVHPCKAEVRFAFQQDVHHFVSESIRRALSQNTPSDSPFLEEPSGSGQSPTQKSASDSRQNYTPVSPNPMAPGKQVLDLFYSKNESGPRSESLSGFENFDKKPLPVASLIYSDFEPLGQLDHSFIVLQGKGGIVIVDQHIAHERILYERFRNAAKSRTVEVQQLLFPQTLQFSPSEAQLVNNHLEMLMGLGLELEPFGGNEFLLRSVPAILKGEDHSDLLRDIVEELRGPGKVEAVREKYEEIVIMMSCRKAIKVNHPLDMDQIRKLLFDLQQTEMPYTCPHGRPIALHFEMDNILKKFLRK